MRENRSPHHPAREPLFIRPEDKDHRFLKLTNRISRQNVSRCWHCWTCGGGCPVSDQMDLLPNQVIRLVQLGRRDEALGCKTIWLCIGCHTCSGQCPNSIDIAAVMDALRQLAIHDGVACPEKEILLFHKHVYESIARYGRLNKLEAMARFKLATGRPFSDIGQGVRMLLKGKLELTRERIQDHSELKRIFDHYDDHRGSFKAHE